MKKNNAGEIEELLRSTPLQQPPDDMVERVMSKVLSQQQSWFSRCWRKLFSPISVSFQPGYVLATAIAIVCAFWLGSSGPIRPEIIPPTVSVATEDGGKARAAYFIGRGYLEHGHPEQSLAYLEQASQTVPGNPEYAYWLGVAYWKNNDLAGERKSYLRAVKQATDSYPLLLNLGHNYLNSSMFEEALASYNKALSLSPSSADALYGIALTYKLMGTQKDEIRAWKNYLAAHNSGRWAYRAVQELNRYQDFTYRTYQLGVKRVVVSQERLLSSQVSPVDCAQELSEVILFLKNNPATDVEVIVFKDQDVDGAKAAAIKMKQAIVGSSPGDISNRVHLSWFDIAEPIEKNGQDSTVLPEGVLIFSRFPMNEQKEV